MVGVLVLGSGLPSSSFVIFSVPAREKEKNSGKKEEKLHYNAHYQLTYLRQETPERQLYGPPRRQSQTAMATATLSKYVASWCYSSHGIINFTYN